MAAPTRTFTDLSTRRNPNWRGYEPDRHYEVRLARVIRQGAGFYARWELWDADEQWRMSMFCTLHTADGRVDVAGEFVPTSAQTDLTLTADEIAAADDPQAPEHPAYELARAGYRADRAHRNLYLKAADMVAGGRVERHGYRVATVQGDSGTYLVQDRRCQCAFATYNPGRTCSHIIAARMVEALMTDEEKAAAHEARVAKAEQERRERIANRGPNVYSEWRRQALTDNEGARSYMRIAMANGATSFRQDIVDRATGRA